jgi:hypothetical protein
LVPRATRAVRKGRIQRLEREEIRDRLFRYEERWEIIRS